ncbi:MAG: DUF192 domain-containing protein [Gammaproteobacteria bacterium]|nr:DUF192 domain-containing protein [Gammaproteobacteria bacterium]
MKSPFKIFLGIANTDGLCFEIRLATRISERCRGLLGGEPLTGRTGLLLWPGGSVHTFGMNYPIDVLFLDDELRVLNRKSSLYPRQIALAPWRTQGTLELAAEASRCIEVGQQFQPYYGDSNQCCC